MRVSTLMRPLPLVTISGEQSVASARALMAAHGIRHLPVVEAGRLVGLVTERELLRALLTIRLKPSDLPVCSVMVREVLTVGPATPLPDALHAINAQKFGCLPVVDGGALVGILTATDLLQFAERAAIEQHLRELAGPAGEG